MSQDNKTQYYSTIVAKGDVQQDKNNNDYCTVSIESKAAVTRFNPFTKEDEVVPAQTRIMNVNAWAGGVDAPWNHTFNMNVGDPVIGQPLRVDCEPYEIDGRTYRHATLMVPDTMDQPTWPKSVARMMRWDSIEPAGDIVLPISVVESTGEKEAVTTKADKAAKLDI